MAIENECWVEKGGVKIVFDIRIDTDQGALYCAYFKRGGKGEVAAPAANADEGKKLKLSIKQAHARLGHCSEQMAREASKSLNWEITRGGLGACADCAIGKAKQKNIPKTTLVEAREDGPKRAYLDIASLKPKSNVKMPTKFHWRVIAIGGINLRFTKWFETKDAMVEPTVQQLHRWKQAGVGIDVLRMDSAGENKALQQMCESAAWKLPITFEYTGKATPQQNSPAEVSFAVLGGRGRAMMSAANVPEDMRYLFFPHVTETATKVDGLMVIEWKGKMATKYEHWFGKIPKFAKYLRTWGEAGVVTTKAEVQPKPKDRGTTCMFIGYADDHDGDVYKMWNPETNRLLEPRDVIWLRRMFFPSKNKPEAVIHGTENTEAEEGEGIDMEVGSDDPEWTLVERKKKTPQKKAAKVPRGLLAGSQTTLKKGTTRSGRAVKPSEKMSENLELAQLRELFDDEEEEADVPRSPRMDRGNSSDEEEAAMIAAEADGYEIKLTEAEEKYYDAMQWLAEEEESFEGGEFACVGAGIGGGFVDTHELHVLKYDEAMATGDEDKWHDAVEEEHERMVDHDVFEAVPRDKLPKDAKVLTSTWAMKKKASGIFRARMNARGFEQVDGIHYKSEDKASPVVQLTTVMIVLTLIIMLNWYAILMDIKGAFLLGDFEADLNMYLEVPQGFERFYPSNVVLRLKKTLYGTKQGAKRFWLKLLSIIKIMMFARSKADPCLYYKWTDDGLVVIVSWVDDLLMAGNKELVLQAKKDLTDNVDCDDTGELSEYVGCKIERDKDSIKITQPVLLQSFKDEFDIPDELKDVKTPAPKGQVLLAGAEEHIVSDEEQSTYRSGVGKLLHLMRWSRPEMSNAVRELTRFFSKASMAHVKAMYRVMQYGLNTEKRGRVLKPTRKCAEENLRSFKFRIKGRSDSDFAKDPETRRSVTGWSVFLEDAPTATKCKMQDGVSTAVSCAEYVAGADCAQEMLFQYRILTSIGLQVELPMVLEMDNKGAIDLANNWSASGRSRWIDVKYHFLRELKEQGMLVFRWISTDAMSSDIFTKNVDGPTFEKHTPVYCGDEGKTGPQIKEEGVAGR